MNANFLIILIALLVFILPFVFIDAIFTVIVKLGVTPVYAAIIVFAMLVGSLINIPIFRQSVVTSEPRQTYIEWSLTRYWPNFKQPMNECVIAINVGGFIIPVALVIYEVTLISWQRPDLLLALGSAVLFNIALCFQLARPISKVGITLPVIIPGISAALCALLLASEMAPPIAFCAGVLGPVVGADLMNLKYISKTQVGVASIGGAGTFDGIVITGLLAVLLS
jgi:uncharacterized membrane protein